MDSKFPNLFSPLNVGGRVYPNRIVNAPRGGIWDENPESDHADPEQLTDARVKCAGGIGAYEIGETAVSPKEARMANPYYGFHDFSERHTLRYREYAQVIHANGALALVELSHAGIANADAKEDEIVLGPSEGVTLSGHAITPMTEEDIAELCTDFADAAFFMKETGYDGVDIHCGHGWLPHQFLSPRWNKRTDRFGGSPENRSRLTIMICDAIRERCGGDFIIECRISGEENTEDGYSREEIIGFCQRIEKHCDLIQVSAGIYNRPMETRMMSTLYDPHGCNVEVAASIKAAVSIPVAVVGGINDPEDAEMWIRDGKCDLVVLCRQLQADPRWAEKAKTGHTEQIRKCLRCMRCYPGPYEEAFAELNGIFPEGCSVNPYLLHYDMNDAPKAEISKQVLVIGGGVAGMQAAITAADRGHSVTLIEKGSRLGGILNFAEHDQDKYDLKALADAMAAELSSREVSVLLNTPFEPELLDGKDTVICALGSSPLLLPIPGLVQALPALESYRPDARIGDTVIILGGGLVGAETAIHLAKAGKTVSIVELRNALAPDAYRLHKHKVNQMIAANPRITVWLNTACKEVRGGTVIAERDGETLTLTADTVISALGMKANPTDAIRIASEAAGAEYHAIGDCVKARKIFDAIEEGFLTAMKL